VRRLVVWSVAFSQDGTRLASASDDGSVKLWETAGGKELRTLKGGGYGLAFSPDGSRLASGTSSGPVLLWDARSLSPELLVEREALGLVEFLFTKLLIKAQVMANLRANRTISDPVRRQAIAFAERWREDPQLFNAASWSVVAKPGADRSAYRLALSQAEYACELSPNNGLFLNTLGIAQYRTGAYQQALETLLRSDKLNAIQFNGSHPADLAFLAMTAHQLGRNELARETLRRLREALKKPVWAGDEEAQAFLHEAEALLQDSKD